MSLRLAVPWLVAACGGGEPVQTEGVEEAFRALHASIYEAYSVGADRDALHDLLSESFVGEALTEQYVEHWRTLVRMEEEETAIQVTGVEYEAVELLADALPRLQIDASWWVRGIVTHQQHKHPRINRYRAIYTLERTADGLRVVDTRMRDLARVATEIPADAIFEDDVGSGAGEGFIDPLELFQGGLFDTDEEAD